MDFSLMRWELMVAGLALALIIADLILPRTSRHAVGMAATTILGAFFLWSLVASGLPEGAHRMLTAGGLYVLDPLAVWGKQFSMLATVLTMFMSLRFMDRNEEHPCEYLALQLIACVGMMLVASAADFLSLFIALELMTVSFYILVGFQSRNALCLEAGLKYLIYGALSSGVLLYGIALIYASSSHFDFAGIAQQSWEHVASNNNWLMPVGLMLVLAGLAFKISAVPFHWWTPDVYEGAPTPTAALLSIGSKGAGFILLVRVLFEAFFMYSSLWLPLLVVASGASILFGNLAALSQGNLKRLMGYSSISHSGYMLLGVAATSYMGLSAVLYYLVAYLLANALVFGAMCETAAENPRQDIREYAGLGRRSPWAAAALLVGLLSLSGIPPLAGFFGKLLIFSAAMQQHMFWLLGIALAGAVCSLYYYLSVVRTMYFSEHTESQSPIPVTTSTRWVFTLLILGVILAGFYQSPWWQASEAAIRSFHR